MSMPALQPLLRSRFIYARTGLVPHTDLATYTRISCAFLYYDPEPGVPKDVTPMAQCAFECSVFKVSAVHTTYRSWLRSSSIYEPSDPPIRLEFIIFSTQWYL